MTVENNCHPVRNYDDDGERKVSALLIKGDDGNPLLRLYDSYDDPQE